VKDSRYMGYYGFTYYLVETLEKSIYLLFAFFSLLSKILANFLGR